MSTINDIISDIKFYQAGKTPREKRDAWFVANSPIKLSEVETPRIESWAFNVQMAESILVVDPKAKYKEVCEKLRWKKRRQEKLKEQEKNGAKACVVFVVNMFFYRDAKHVINDWLHAMQIVRRAENTFFSACRMSKCIATMRWVMNRWEYRFEEDSVTSWRENAHDDINIQERQRKLEERESRAKGKAEIMAKAMMEEQGSSGGDGGREPYFSIANMQKMERQDGPHHRFAAWMLANNREQFTIYDFDLSGRVNFRELKIAVRSYIDLLNPVAEEEEKLRDDYSYINKEMEETKRQNESRSESVRADFMKNIKSGRRWGTIVQKISERFGTKDMSKRYLEMQRDRGFTQLMMLCLKHPVLELLCKCVDSMVYSARMLKTIKQDTKRLEYQLPESLLKRGEDVGNMNKTDMRVARMLFNRSDEANSRSLDKPQVSHLMENMGVGVDEKELDDIFTEMDKNHNGRIDFLEFTEYIFTPIPRERRPTLQKLKSVMGGPRILQRALSALW